MTRQDELQQEINASTSLLQDPNWIERISALAASRTDLRDDHQFLKAASQIAHDHIKDGHADVGRRWAALALALADRRAHEALDGLRPSTLPGRERKAVEVLESLEELAVSGRLGIAQHREALASRRIFAEAFVKSRSEESRIQYWLTRSPFRIAQTIVSIIESAFDERTPRIGITTGVPLAFEELAFEQACIGASYLLDALGRMGRLKMAESLPPQVPGGVAECRRNILGAFWLHEMLEQEIFVFRMGYRCHREADGTCLVEAPNDTIGLALSYGYHQAGVIPHFHAWRHRRHGNSLEDVTKIIAEAAKDIRPYVLIKSEGRLHFRYVIREGYAAAIKKILGRREMYLEEEHALFAACQELRTTSIQLLGFELSPGVTVADALKFTRLFRFLMYARVAELERSGLTLEQGREALPLVMQKEGFIALASVLGFEKSCTEAFLAVFSWSPQARRRLDIQYTPIIDMDAWLVIPLSVAERSNIIRNGLALRRARIYRDGTDDPLVEDLLRACEKGRIRAWRNVRYTSQGKRYELDLVALVDSVLLVIEAKNSLLPCSAFDLRTTWDYLDKAADQLDGFKKALQYPSLLLDLERRLGIHIDPANVRTCIALGHLLLAGSDFRGHPVRSVVEICSYLASGGGLLWIGEQPLRIRYRPNGPVTSESIEEFLSPQSPVHRSVRAAMYKRLRKYGVGRARMGIVEYGVNAAAQLMYAKLCSEPMRQALADALAAFENARTDSAVQSEAADAAWRAVENAYHRALNELEARAIAEEVSDGHLAK